MFRHLLALALLGFFGSLIADDFSNFRIPKNRVFRASAWAEATFERHQRGGEDLYYPYASSFEHSLWESAESGVEGEWLSDSDKLSTSATFGVAGAERLATGKSRSDYARSSSREYGLKALPWAGGSVTYFPRGGLFGVFASSYADVEYGQSGSTGESYYRNDSYESWQDRDSERWGQDYYFRLEIGPSLGRIRDVTAIADALVMEKRLIEEGVLAAELKQTTRQALAELLYKEPSYEYLHDRYERFFWRDVESILKADSAFRGPLDAYSLHRIKEEYLGMWSRRQGWVIQPSFSYWHYNDIAHYWNRSENVTSPWYERNTEEDYSSSHRTRDYHLLGLRAAYARTFGLDWQADVDWEVYYTGDRESYSEPSQEREFFASEFGAMLTYQIADRWLATGGFDIGVVNEDIQNHEPLMYMPDSYHYHSFEGDARLVVRYRIEDHVSLYGALTESYDWVERYSDADEWSDNEVGWHSNDRHDIRFYLGVDYALKGSTFGTSNWHPYFYW